MTSMEGFLEKNALLTVVKGRKGREFKFMAIPPQAIKAAAEIAAALIEWQSGRIQNNQLSAIVDKVEYVTSLCITILDELKALRVFIAKELEAQFRNALEIKIKSSLLKLQDISSILKSNKKLSARNIEDIQSVFNDCWGAGYEVIQYGVPAYAAATVAISNMLVCAELLARAKKDYKKDLLKTILSQYMNKFFNPICLDPKFEGSLVYVSNRERENSNKCLKYVKSYSREGWLGYSEHYWPYSTMTTPMRKPLFHEPRPRRDYTAYYGTIKGDADNLPISCEFSREFGGYRENPRDLKPFQNFDTKMCLDEDEAKMRATQIGSHLTSKVNEGNKSNKTSLELAAIALGIIEFMSKAEEFVAALPRK